MSSTPKQVFEDYFNYVGAYIVSQGGTFPAGCGPLTFTFVPNQGNAYVIDLWAYSFAQPHMNDLMQIDATTVQALKNQSFVQQNSRASFFLAFANAILTKAQNQPASFTASDLGALMAQYFGSNPTNWNL